jgi:hypothetical protein
MFLPYPSAQSHSLRQVREKKVLDLGGVGEGWGGGWGQR